MILQRNKNNSERVTRNATISWSCPQKHMNSLLLLIRGMFVAICMHFTTAFLKEFWLIFYITHLFPCRNIDLQSNFISFCYCFLQKRIEINIFKKLNSDDANTTLTAKWLRLAGLWSNLLKKKSKNNPTFHTFLKFLFLLTLQETEFSAWAQLSVKLVLTKRRTKSS